MKEELRQKLKEQRQRLKRGWDKKFVSDLPRSERRVLRLRFTKTKTLEQAGESLGVSKQRVMQIEHKALRSLIRRRSIASISFRRAPVA